MLYSILFATLVYLNNARDLLQLPDVTEYTCTDDTGCAELEGNSFVKNAISPESFTCSSSMGYCTITCTSTTPDSCASLSLVGVTGSECTSEDGVEKCIVDLECTTSADCTAVAGLSRCDTDTNTCIAQTAAPTDPPVTRSPTVTPDPDATKTPTPKPTTTAEKRATCEADCKTDSTTVALPMYCEAYVDYAGLFTLDIECEDVDSACEAGCLTDYTKTVEIAKVDQSYIPTIEANLPDDLVAEFCYTGRCSDTPSPTVTEEDGTSSPTTTAQNDCIVACESEADNAMYCEGDETIFTERIIIPCTDVRNKCEAECLTAATKEELTKEYDDSTKELIDNYITSEYGDAGLVGSFCYEGSCPDDEPTTTDPCDDPYWDNIDECEPETPDDSCGVQFNVTLNFCVVNRKFKMRQIWGFVKEAYALAIDTVSDYSGYCDADVDISITRYEPGYNEGLMSTDDARKRGKKRPQKKRDTDLAVCNSYTADDWEIDDCCEAIDDICGEDKGNKQFSIGIGTEFNCGDDCDTMRKIAVQIVEKLQQFDAKVILECLGFGVDGDTVCTTGFGGMQMEVAKAVLAYKDDDGVIEVIAEHSSEAGASEITYGFALIFAFIMAAIY